MQPDNSYDLKEVKARIHQYLVSKTNFVEVKDKLNDDQLREFVDRAISELCAIANINISFDDRASIIRELVSALISLGPLRELQEDPTVTEIMVNGPSSVYVQRHGKIELTDVKFRDNNALMHLIQKILSSSASSRRVDESSPYVDFSMADGSRVNVILPPCSLAGPIVTIRKFDTKIDTVDDLIERGTMNKQMATLLTSAVNAKLNIVFCGATGCGKTTTLNVLSTHIPEEERIITIEDTSELRLHQEHVVSLQSKGSNIEGKGAVSIRDLFINSLRMRPDRIIVGEIRGEEILDMIQSISSGHSGSLSIIHAESAEECYMRMKTMMIMSGIRLSGAEIEKQIATGIDLIVFAELYIDGTRRISNITDIHYNKERGKVELEDVFTFDQKEITTEGKVIGDWVLNRKKPSFMNKFIKYGVHLPDGFFDKG